MLHCYHMTYAVGLDNYVLTTNYLSKDFLSKLAPSTGVNLSELSENAKQMATKFKKS